MWSWSSGRQPYLLILLNKWAAFMLSVGWNKRGGRRRYIIACKINVLSALLGGGGEMIAGELSDPPPVCFFFFS